MSKEKNINDFSSISEDAKGTFKKIFTESKEALSELAQRSKPKVSAVKEQLGENFQEHSDRLKTCIKYYSQLGKRIWSTQSFEQLKEGYLNIPEEIINDFLGNQKFLAIHIRSARVYVLKDSLEIYLDSLDLGMVCITLSLEKFVHNKNESYITLKILDTRILQQPKIFTWIISNISCIILGELFDIEKTISGLRVKVADDLCTIDFKGKSDEARMASDGVLGYKMIDILEIKGAAAHLGVVRLDCELNFKKQ